jgi:hypothetical protein
MASPKSCSGKRMHVPQLLLPTMQLSLPALSLGMNTSRGSCQAGRMQLDIVPSLSAAPNQTFRVCVYPYMAAQMQKHANPLRRGLATRSL